MIPYILIALAPLVLYIPFDTSMRSVDVAIQKKAKIKYLIFCGIVLMLFMGLRNPTVGSTDTVNYYNNMRKAILAASWREYYNKTYVETGFQFFVFLLSRVFNDPQMLILITSAIYVFCLCFFIYHNSDDIVFSLVMYISLGLMTFQMQGMRQALAMGICMVAYEFAKKKKTVLFSLFVILAVQFHRTAIVFFLVILVAQLSYNLFNLILLFFASAVVLSQTERIISFGNQLFDRDYAHTTQGGGYIATLIYIIILVFTILFNKQLKHDKKHSTMLYVLILGTVSYIMRYTGIMIAERISFYFAFSQLAILPNSINFAKPNDRFMIKFAAVTLTILLFMYRLNGSDLLPYRFFWS